MTKTDFLNSLPAYDVNPQVDRLLELPRTLVESSAYIPQVFAVPMFDESTIGARRSLEERIRIEPGSLIVGFGGYSEQPEGFEFQVYDDGFGDYLAGLKFVKDRLLAAFRLGRPSGQGFLLTPYVVSGQIVVQITNLSSNNNRLQLVIYAAVLRTSSAINQMEARNP
jgi:hypothetical protein